MIDHAVWLAPVLVVLAGAPLAVLGLRRIRAARSEWRKDRQRRRRYRERVARDLEAAREVSQEPLGPVFTVAPHAVEIASAGGRVVVVHAAIGNAPMREDVCLQEMMAAVLGACSRHGTGRVLLEMIESWPSSRRFWHALRHLGRECAGVGGLLVVRVEGGEASAAERGPFYVRLDGSVSVESALREAALGARLEAPELDAL
ncbi:MAG: hypothetical protein IPJ41_07855 [Phycisphaerales bacterium]|nr:hypothetical protein [Phycisphaerales bacterium]